MKIIYRDELGVVSNDRLFHRLAEVDVNTEYGISFDGKFAYFSDEQNRDYRVATSALVEIQE